MNLFDMLRRGDDVLVVRPGTQNAKWTNGPIVWRSLRVQPDGVPQIEVKGVTGWYPFTTRPETVGWYARTLRAAAKATIRLITDQRTLAQETITIDERPTPVPVPWPLSAAPLIDDTALSLHFELAQGQVAELMINRDLDRSELIALARGDGVEIGPGSNPQVANGPGVSVRYIEEMPPDRWRDLYDKSGQYHSTSVDWSRYIVGKASSLPVDDRSLDFIFSSHVFEHLANPLGHLEHWGCKLKSGGVVLAIVPDIAGTKDFRHQPSLLEEMIREYKAGVWEPERLHYDRWARTRGRWAERVDDAMSEQRSIHVHYYTRENMTSLLRYANDILPFSGYHIRHTPNHRDFFWVLNRK